MTKINALIIVDGLHFQLKDDQVNLQSICFSPMMSDDKKPASPRQCMVQSVWGYFKNNENRFNRTLIKRDGTVEDYLTYIKDCVQ